MRTADSQTHRDGSKGWLSKTKEKLKARLMIPNPSQSICLPISPSPLSYGAFIRVALPSLKPTHSSNP